ncbi:MAG: GerMN domain-containing protein [Lachnospiraceae bacterium]|nr:GerMN domain-containing protein [Lachnospiraceae bacterium]
MRKISIWMIVFLMIFLLCGCGQDTDSDSDYYIYYMNTEKTTLVPQPYELQAEPRASADLRIQELYEALCEDADSMGCVRIIPDDVKMVGYQLEESQLSIYWNKTYAKMSTPEEILCRAAVVKTMIQLPEVSCVAFYVGEAPLTDSKGALVGLMTEESFVENPGEQINAIQSTVLHLYFSNEAGDGLVEEEREVQYSTSMSMEKLVMEHLLKGPERPGMKGTIPSGTHLIHVTTTNGICYVNFDEGFLNQNYEIQEPIVLYSVVDSLSELANVNKVQISVNGNSGIVYRESYSLEKPFERNLDFLSENLESLFDTEREEEAQ